MRRLMTALLAVVLPAMLITGVTTAEAAPKQVAEVGCTSFSSATVSEDNRYFVHVPSTSADSYNYNCVLARGHRNIGVLALQESLNACFLRPMNLTLLVEDSDFGGKTEEAVRTAQRAINARHGFHVVDVDGRFGPITSGYFTFQIYDHWNGGAHTRRCL